VTFGTYRELFVATAGAAGALTGLLFVALSITPLRGPSTDHPVIRQVRVAAALLAFVNALAVSLYSLVPGTSTGYPATVMGVIGTLFTAAAIRSIVSSHAARQQLWHQLGLVILLLLIFGTELVGGIALLADAGNSNAVSVISYAMVSSLMVGIARAWELVGDRDTGILSSLAVLIGRQPAALSAPAPGESAKAVKAAPDNDAAEIAPGARQASKDDD
jgi:hypothetical protein